MANFLILARRCLRFARGRPREAVIVARMALDIAAFSILIKMLPLPRALTLLSPSPRRSVRDDRKITNERLAQLLDALLGLNVLCFTPICWRRAAVLHRQMALAGLETRVLFGLRKDSGDLLAGHAWVESGGQPLFETVAPRYAVTYSYPPDFPAPHSLGSAGQH